MDGAAANGTVPLVDRDLRIQFRGTAGAYFAIWIVNILLTSVTMGIYSAWAKVRLQRYLLGNTLLDGRSFDYKATGWIILKGRLIAGLLILGFVILGLISPLLQALAGLAFLPLMPWVINRSLRFNARMTAWRNVRFDFVGTYWKTAFYLFLLPILVFVTAGLAIPFVSRLSARYIARHYRFGTAAFDANPSLRPYLVAFGQTLLVFVGAGAVFYALGYVAFLIVGTPADMAEHQSLLRAVFSGYVAMLIAGLFMAGRFQAILVSSLRLEGGHGFTSSLSGLKLLWITVSNLIAIGLSFGLLFPWARIRLWRYHCAVLTVHAHGSLDTFADTVGAAGGAFGAEYADLQGAEVGIGF